MESDDRAGLILDPATLPVSSNEVINGAQSDIPNSKVQNEIPAPYTVYPQRWLVLAIFAFNGVVGIYIGNTYSPVASSMESLLYWNTKDITVLSFYYFVANLFLSIPVAWLMGRFGLRAYMIASAGILCGGTLVRCFHGGSVAIATGLINFSALLTSFSGLSSGAAAVMLTSLWFPPNEWRFATCIGVFSQRIGLAVSFVVGPMVIPDPENAGRLKILHKYFAYTYAETALSILAFFAVMAYFPDKPPTPPSKSASESRELSIKHNFKAVSKSVDFWLLAGYSTTFQGALFGIMNLLSIYLGTMGVNNFTAGMVGFASTTCVVPFGTLMGKVADRVQGSLKALIVTLSVLSFEGAIWLFLMSQHMLPSSTRSIFVAFLLYSVSVASSSGIYNELLVETLYPASEPVILGIVQTLQTAHVVIFCIILMIPSLNASSWMGFYVLFMSILTLAFAIGLPQKYKRSAAENKNK